MFYTVVEVQVMENGAKGCLTYIFDNYNDALAKLYTVLAAAAQAGLPYHGCFVLSSDGTLTDGKAFDRRGESEE